MRDTLAVLRHVGQAAAAVATGWLSVDADQCVIDTRSSELAQLYSRSATSHQYSS